MLAGMFANSGSVPGLKTDGTYYWSSDIGTALGNAWVVAPGPTYVQTAGTNARAIRCVRPS